MKIVANQDSKVSVFEDGVSIKEVITTLMQNNESEDDAFYCVDIGDILKKHEKWKYLLPRIEPFYAIKCNTDPVILELMVNLGIGFDCASQVEIDTMLSYGVEPNRIIFANPCKQLSHIKYAVANGVDLMAFDNEMELQKVKTLAPNSRLLLRILTDDSKSLCQLGIKYGAALDQCQHLLKVAKQLDLNVVGVSFHVGSGCFDATAFKTAVESARLVFDWAMDIGFAFSLLDVGGGFPGSASKDICFEEVCSVLNNTIDDCFPSSSGVQIIAEPGRFYVSTAFTLVANVTSRRETKLKLSDDKVLLLCCVCVIINKFGILQFGRAVTVFRRMIRRHPRPVFPVNYHSTGLLRLPRSGIKEPFEVWFSRKDQRSRVDFYYGTDQTYQRLDLGAHGTAFKVVPMYNERRGNFKGCWYRNGTRTIPIIPQPILPNIEEFEFVGIEVFEGTETSKWQHHYKTYDLNNVYTFWITNTKPPRPVKYEMKGYDSLLATHYDYYVLDYISFEEWKPNESVFELPSDLWCRNWSHKLDSHLMTNPMQEFMTSHHVDKEEHLEQLYSIFRRRHQKSYRGRMERNKRKHLFRHNLRFIHSTNRKNLNFKLSTNHMADVGDDEYIRYRGSKEERRYIDHRSNQSLMNDGAFNISGVPDTLDWRDYGAVGQVRSQGNCASCYALVAAQAIETTQFFETGNLTTLAPQQIMDCSWGSGNEGCKGGWYSKAFSWVYLHSLRPESSYGPYLAQEGACHSNGEKKGATIDGFAYVPKRNNTALKIAIAKYGTAAVSINTSPMTFKFYGWGIYDDPKCDDSDNSHTVLVVGYGIQRGTPYWLIKNSWSESWALKATLK